ncbi:ubiquitin-associated protein 2 [Cricetulus griseus]
MSRDGRGGRMQATAEQMRLAQVIFDKNDSDFEAKVKQLMEVTGKNQDESIVALHDCNGDVNKAINVLLEGDSDTVPGKILWKNGQQKIGLKTIDLVALLQKPVPPTQAAEANSFETSQQQGFGQALVFTNSQHSNQTAQGSGSSTSANSYSPQRLSSVLGSGFGELAPSKMVNISSSQILDKLKAPSLNSFAATSTAPQSSTSPPATTASWDLKPSASQSSVLNHFDFKSQPEPSPVLSQLSQRQQHQTPAVSVPPPGLESFASQAKHRESTPGDGPSVNRLLQLPNMAVENIVSAHQPQPKHMKLPKRRIPPASKNGHGGGRSQHTVDTCQCGEHPILSHLLNSCNLCPKCPIHGGRLAWEQSVSGWDHSKAPPNLPQGVPPLLHNQYLVGPGGLLPAYPIYGYDELQMLQSRLPMDYYGIPFAAPTALASRDGSLANNPYSGDITKFGRGDSASPAPPTTPAQAQQSQSQTHHTAQQPFLNPALPPGYSYTGLPYYTGVPSAFQYGPTMFVPPTSAKQHGVTLNTPPTPFQQASGYGQHTYSTGVSVSSGTTGLPDMTGSVYNKTQSGSAQRNQPSSLQPKTQASKPTYGNSPYWTN